MPGSLHTDIYQGRRKNPQHVTPLRSRIEDVQRGHQVGELTSYSLKNFKETDVLVLSGERTQKSNVAHLRDHHQTTPTEDTALINDRYYRGTTCTTAHIYNVDTVEDFTQPLPHPFPTITNPPFSFPLSLDHLVPVVRNNIYRAIVTNLFLLNLSPYSICTPEKSPPLYSILPLPLPAAIPYTLAPTPTQLRIPHPEWMNVLPHPSMRDALILRWASGTSTSNSALCTITSRYRNRSLDEYALSFDLLGAVNGGDPWEPSNWEVTEGFIRKWGWMMKGCWENVLEATNYWRGVRGEDPLAWVEDEESWV
ncbi:hypothetical protein P280DRAFT_522379 [Massarina eburnea CBS 473.64]|uniref:Uncharacterized protein n=1 Tax=Massarina eburnea CBS 473.64 TaxID=1395130 RepID=A0A6A6RKM8_9PLEO|nr:hypothetical protein P280DRAFT_522379 [Massarina eburnea CBS 473.64]